MDGWNKGWTGGWNVGRLDGGRMAGGRKDEYMDDWVDCFKITLGGCSSMITLHLELCDFRLPVSVARIPFHLISLV